MSQLKKITHHHIKNQEDLKLNEKRQIDASTGITEMLELSNKDFKVVTI